MTRQEAITRHLKAKEKSRIRAKEIRCQFSWGCSRLRYLDIRGVEGRIVRAYSTHKSNAATRGIKWGFNLSSWWAVWENSKHWHEMGRRRGQYVMARFRDTGPYSPENVKIITCSENLQERGTFKEALCL